MTVESHYRAAAEDWSLPLSDLDRMRRAVCRSLQELARHEITAEAVGTFNTVAGTAEYAFPGVFTTVPWGGSVYLLYLTATNSVRELREVSPGEYDRLKNAYPQQQTPTIFAIWNRKIVFHPTPEDIHTIEFRGTSRELWQPAWATSVWEYRNNENVASDIPGTEFDTTTVAVADVCSAAMSPLIAYFYLQSKAEPGAAQRQHVAQRAAEARRAADEAIADIKGAQGQDERHAGFIQGRFGSDWIPTKGSSMYGIHYSRPPVVGS